MSIVNCLKGNEQVSTFVSLMGLEMEEFTEPGAARHGNFINYYDFNSATERLNLLPSDTSYWLHSRKSAAASSYLVLDIGCNAGDFTQLLYEFLCQRLNKEIVILGIDIDPTLIERAAERNRFPQNVHYACCDFMATSSERDCIAEHLIKFGRQRFDAVCCMSITMWIHLNNGDCGLKQFLQKVCKLSETLVIEPQPWRCYTNATRRLRRAKVENAFPLFNDLKLRNNVENEIKLYLSDHCAFSHCYESDATKWKRRICFYKRNS